MSLTLRYGWVDSISDDGHGFLSEDVVVSAEEFPILQKSRHNKDSISIEPVNALESLLFCEKYVL